MPEPKLPYGLNWVASLIVRAFSFLVWLVWGWTKEVHWPRDRKNLSPILILVGFLFGVSRRLSFGEILSHLFFEKRNIPAYFVDAYILGWVGILIFLACFLYNNFDEHVGNPQRIVPVCLLGNCCYLKVELNEEGSRELKFSWSNNSASEFSSNSYSVPSRMLLLFLGFQIVQVNLHRNVWRPIVDNVRKRNESRKRPYSWVLNLFHGVVPPNSVFDKFYRHIVDKLFIQDESPRRPRSYGRNLFNAVIGYIELNWVFGIVYWFFGTSLSKTPNSVFHCIYFSFVTGSTLGYGEITPHSSSPNICLLAVIVFHVLSNILMIAIVIATASAAITQNPQQTEGPEKVQSPKRIGYRYRNR